MKSGGAECVRLFPLTLSLVSTIPYAVMTASAIGFLFPGQGSQSVGMGRGLYDAFPAVRAVYEEASTILGYDAAQLCFEGPVERLNLTEHTQPALLVSSAAALKALEPAGLSPLAVAGHSLGEYSAVFAAGGLSFRDAVALVQKRGRYMAEAVPPGTGLVAALLGLSAEVVKAVCQEASSVGREGCGRTSDRHCQIEGMQEGDSASGECTGSHTLDAGGCRPAGRGIRRSRVAGFDGAIDQ